MVADQQTETYYSSGEESNSESEDEEVINLALMATHDSEASTSTSAVKVRLTSEFHKVGCDDENQLVIQLVV